MGKVDIIIMSSYQNCIWKNVLWGQDADILSDSDGQERSPSSCCRPQNNLLANLFECLSSRVAVIFTICQIVSRANTLTLEQNEMSVE